MKKEKSLFQKRVETYEHVFCLSPCIIIGPKSFPFLIKDLRLEDHSGCLYMNAEAAPTCFNYSALE